MTIRNITVLETFVWVSRLKSFTLAARHMNTTQAAISSRIASLEDDLGVSLFVREYRAIKLTPEGSRALPKAIAVLTAVQDLMDEMRSTDEIDGVIRIGIIDTIHLSWLAEFLRRLRVSMPRIDTVLITAPSVEQPEMLTSGELDLALLMGPVLSPEFVCEDLCSFACHWVASTSFALGDAEIDLRDRPDLPVISFPSRSQPKQAFDRHFAGLEKKRSMFYEANLSLMIEMAKEGVGIATIPAVVVSRELQMKELALANATQKMPPMNFHAVYRKDHDKKFIPAVAEFARQVAEEYCDRNPAEWAWHSRR